MGPLIWAHYINIYNKKKCKKCKKPKHKNKQKRKNQQVIN